MRISCGSLALLAALAVPLSAGAQGLGQFDWSRWRDLPVQNGGRCKPLDSLATETLRLIGNRSSIRDPDSGAKLDANTVYLRMLFDWRGWDHADRERLLVQMNWGPEYFRLHEPDKWDEQPLLRVDNLELRSVLGLPRQQTHIAPADLAHAFVEEPTSGRRMRFTAWADKLLREDTQGVVHTKLEGKALELANHLWTYQNHRMGRGLDILPGRAHDGTEGLSFAALVLTRFDDDSDPTGEIRAAQKIWRQARLAYLANDAETFNEASSELKTVLRSLGQNLRHYPSPARLRLEVAYNRWTPFRWAWVLMLVATHGLALHAASRRPWPYVLSLTAYLLALVAMILGFLCRTLISDRAPVTNMYESIIFVGFGVAVIGMTLEAVYRQKLTLIAAAAVATCVLVLADNSSAFLDPSVRPLEPVLRSNFWLTAHVLTITLSYAAFALALGLANITLGRFLLGSAPSRAFDSLSHFTYKAIQLGVLLLAVGIILGGVWADYTWGRFWGWDPKEVWALVALLGYVCVLHARFSGWVSQRGLAALSVVCFAIVLVSWYGVNFVLGTGLHSYGFGNGGQAWVYGAIALQFIFMGAALLRQWHREQQPTVTQPSHETPQARAAIVDSPVT